MRAARLFSLELRRLLRGRLSLLALLLTALSPLAGLTFYRPIDPVTTLDGCLANPSLAGGLAGGVLFGLLAIHECDRARRARVETLVDAAVSPLVYALVRLLALLAFAALALGLTMLAWLPWTAWTAGGVFDLQTYLLMYLVFMGLALPLCVLLGGAAYQFTRRQDLSIVLFAALCALSLTVWAEEWQLCFLNPCVWAVSDDFTNFRILRSVAYVRLTWLLGLAGVWGVSWLCVRRYGKGALGSLLRAARRVYRPAVALCLLAACGWAYAAQPFVDHSNPDLTAMTFYEIPFMEGVTCLSRTADVRPDVNAGTVWGRATYEFANASGREQTVALAINPGYEVTSVKANGADVPFHIGDYQESNWALLQATLPADAQIELEIVYGGFPQEWNVSETMQGSDEISSRYICLEHASLAPYILNAEAEGGVLPATIEVTLPTGMTAIPFGTAEAEAVSENGDGTATWRYEDEGPGGILYAGDYVCADVEAAGLTVRFYYGRKHQGIMEEAGAADAIRAVAEYCAAHYGAPSFVPDETLKLIESRVSGGGYATAGASLADEQDFTAANLSDAAKGGMAGEVMIHELVHQWWGLGCMFDVADPSGAWSAEGLTVYTCYRIVKELYGEAYAQEHYVEMWRAAVEGYARNFYVRNPEYLTALPEEEQLAIANSLSQIRQYSEMPLKILKAEELVGGEAAMDAILSGLFNRELDPMYPYLTYADFLAACGLTEEDLSLETDLSL